MTIGNQAQRKSELEKHGPGEAHEKAKDRLCLILIGRGFEIFPDAIFQDWTTLDSQNGFNLHSKDYYHEFDIYARKTIPVSDGPSKYDLKAELICWIDGEIHDHEVQQGKDKTAEEYAKFHLPNARMIRIPIDVLIGAKKWDDRQINLVYKL